MRKKRLVNLLVLSLISLMFLSCSKELSEEQFAEEIRSRVKFTRSDDLYTRTYNFTSTLKEEFSPDRFRYCVMYGTEDNMDWYTWHDDSNSSTFDITLFLTTGDNWAGFELYYASFKSIEKKIKSGQSLTAEERGFYNNLKKELNKMLVSRFASRAYVELDGEKYYLE